MKTMFSLVIWFRCFLSIVFLQCPPHRPTSTPLHPEALSRKQGEIAVLQFRTDNAACGCRRWNRSRDWPEGCKLGADGHKCSCCLQGWHTEFNQCLWNWRVEHPPSFLLLFTSFFCLKIYFQYWFDLGCIVITYLKVTSVKKDRSLSSFYKFDFEEQDQL